MNKNGSKEDWDEENGWNQGWDEETVEKKVGMNKNGRKEVCDE